MIEWLLFILTVFYERLWILYLIPVALIVILILLRLNFTRLRHQTVEEKVRRRRKKIIGRIFLFIARGTAVTLLLIALAGPFVQDSIVIQGEPRVTVLIDESASMDVYDTSGVQPLISDLKDRLPVDVFTIASGSQSDLGDGILSHLEADTPLLLVSDGHVTNGATLDSVAHFAGNVNASLSMLNLPVKENDVYILVEGPAKTLEGVENSFVAYVFAQEEVSTQVVVTLDGETLVTERVTVGAGDVASVPFSATFVDGDHQITARIDHTDIFPANNVFHKTVHVVEKPKVLYVSEFSTPTLTLLKQVYEVTVRNTIPNDLSAYGSIVIHDMHADKFDRDTVNQLTNYLHDGNGLVVLGGLNSFDLGQYEGAMFESLMPVTIGSGEERESDAYVILLIDISKSTRSGFRSGGKYSVSDVIKAQAIALLDTLKPKDNVGIVAFNDRAYKVSPLSPLEEKKGELIDKIARLKFANTTYLNVGLTASYQLLREESGSKSIVLLSDGKVSGYAQDTLGLAAQLGSGNIHLYTVGIGDGTDRPYMKSLARNGKGIYFEPNEFQKLKILFGQPDLSKTEGLAELIILNGDHFITRGLELSAKLGAYNSVVPKSTGQVLLTLETGEPVVTVGRQGLGRVVAMNAFSTNNDLGSLTNAENSKLITRMVNWAIGDPERNAEYFVSVPDTRVGVESLVRVRADKIPVVDGFSFIRDEDGDYTSTFTPSEEGIFPMLTTTYAANAPLELMQTGVSDDLLNAVEVSGGARFNTDQVADIVQFLKAKAKRTQIENINYAYVLIIIALCIFGAEVVLRRIYEMFFQGR